MIFKPKMEAGWLGKLLPNNCYAAWKDDKNDKVTGPLSAARAPSSREAFLCEGLIVYLFFSEGNSLRLLLRLTSQTICLNSFGAERKIPWSC